MRRSRIESLRNFLVAICCSLLMTECVWAALRVKPAYLELSLDKGRPTGRFLISNLSDKEARYRINVVHFATSPSGGASLTDADSPYSLVPWLKFNPREFTLKPNAERAIRFAVVPRGKTGDGEYWGALEFEPLESDVVSGTDGEGRNVNIRVISTVAVPIFAIKGELVHSAEPCDIAVVAHEDGPYLHGSLANTGTGRINLTAHYLVVDPSGELFQEGDIAGLRVTRGSYLRFTEKLEPNMPKGSYSVIMSFQGERLSKPIELEAEVDWTNTPPAAPVDDDGADASAAVPPASSDPKTTVPAKPELPEGKKSGS